MIISSFTGFGKTIITPFLAALSAYIDIYKERNNDQRGVLKSLASPYVLLTLPTYVLVQQQIDFLSCSNSTFTIW